MYAMYAIRACESAITTTVKSQSSVYFPGPGIISPLALESGGGSRSAANKLEKLTSLKRDKGRAGGVKAARSPAPRGGDTQQPGQGGRKGQPAGPGREQGYRGRTLERPAPVPALLAALLFDCSLSPI